MTFGLVKHNNNSISAITSAGQLAQGKMTLIKEQTASSSSSISFVDGSSSVVLDSTYPIYLFKIINAHRSSTGNEQTFTFNLSSDSGSNYNVTKTTTLFDAYHRESGSSGFNYVASQDIAQGTGFQNLTPEVELGEDDDASSSGELFLFNLSSTTFVKHFMWTGNHMSYYSTPWSINSFVAGYANTTSAINGVQFKMSSGNIDSGTFKLYGIKGS
tara:strand:- start:561 stop:1205 length:645 start_codon:yes stop_codon:yes gene_type:complete